MITRIAFDDLQQHADFIDRHIGPNLDDQKAMLATLGFESLDAMTRAIVPVSILSDRPLKLDLAISEAEVLDALRKIADKNQVFKSFIGMGYYNCLTPTVILRNLLENPAWYTAYTPYQPEIAQGRLEALLNFQTMVTELTGMEIANASLLDEATAAAEAMTFCQRVSRNKSKVFFVSQDCFPQTIDVVRTRAAPIGIEVVVGDHRKGLKDIDCFGVLLQYPALDGEIHDYAEIVAKAHAMDALVVVAADLLALTLLTPPGEFGADVAIGTAQRFGVPLGYGGPHAAYFATRDADKRMMPGRVVGVSIDSYGQPAYRLALQTREQHIRREKATSNVCTAQVLLANIASMYAVYHGPQGLKTIAQRVHRLTATLAEGLRKLDIEVRTASFFDTIEVRSSRASEVHDAARSKGINLRIVSGAADIVGVSLDETTTWEDIEALWAIFAGASKSIPSFAEVEAKVADRIPADLVRSSSYLTHPVFNSHHSETQMLRYLRALSDKDLALDRTMIPLGSCTMKLNATTEMIPVTWKEFGAIHPFAPLDQAKGYQQLITELEQMLVTCTGYDAVSLQPNAGSQGEYAGLLAIRAYHESRGEKHRDVCLIPSSAHGTNPATAHMAGMKVVVVQCDARGNVDVADLKAKAEQHAKDLAAIMITYPSTHGVFEEAVGEICEIIHANGGQVYIDGANMNAMVGLCAPGKFGGDVSHLNLHKTFCIPHGGGGPGVGPIGVKAHLAPFLPGHRMLENHAAPVCAAPWGSASILPISWTYIKLMGRQGLKQASQVAILNANYIAKRLAPHYPILYAGENGIVAHECIVDLRPLKDKTGITVDDMAKRLMDFGFHAPTMSFPVPGTLMIEPTESESKDELDRFCDAMIAIREEIRAVEDGKMAAEATALRNAPHTAMCVTGEWNRAYTREQAVFPLKSLKMGNKYWPPVGRIDNVYGDRNLVCSCPPLSEYE
ncbi:aminomethyl-transferring glycine dehydrogenase [soil metagenome]